MRVLPIFTASLITSVALLAPLQSTQAWQGSRHDHDRSGYRHSNGLGFFFDFSPPPIYVVPSRPVYMENRYVESRNVVADVQAALTRRGYEVGGIDGVAGPRTRSALTDFQQARGLRATGEINEATLHALSLN